MASDFIGDKKLRLRNLKKFKEPPHWKLVESVIKKSGLNTFAKFEVVWGLSANILTDYKNHKKGLPIKNWHIFYEFDKIKKAASSGLFKKVKKKEITQEKKSMFHELYFE